MAEYDIALESQVDWSLFWTSDAGRRLFHGLGLAVSKQRKEKGERQFAEMVDHETDELQLVLLPVIHGECYYWSREMLNVVQAAAESLPDSWSLMQSHIPSVSGFFYFNTPLGKGEQAFGWSVLSVESNTPVAVLHTSTDGTMPDFNTVALTIFVKNPDPAFSRPLPCRTTISVGESLRDWKLEAVRHAATINADVSEFSDYYENIRLFGTMLCFIQQRILVPSRWDVSRATRRRIERYYPQREPVINIVRLRSTIHRSPEGPNELVDWTCRWIVRGHWREQWYPSLKKHQPKWITLYIKGPEDKPLKDPRRLFAVVR